MDMILVGHWSCKAWWLLSIRLSLQERRDRERMASTTTTIILSLPTPHQTLLSPRPTSIIRYPSKPIIRLCSYSSSSVSVVEDVTPPSPDATPVQSEFVIEDSDKLPFSGCKGCGREEMERGCNGEGRIQGGIATVPGFGWWPIKAYRPCPAFVASGGRYMRQGQSMDEVASGGGARRGTSAGISSEDQTRKKRQDPRRFKR